MVDGGSDMEEKERVKAILQILSDEHPDAKIALHFSNPLELLVATILSAQSTDKIVNKVTETLFRKYQSAKDYADVDLEELEHDIKPTGFYRRKAQYLKKMARVLVEKYGSKVPKTMEDLITLPGVARKTANIVLSNAFGVIEGIAVDTHVFRLALRLGLSERKDRDKIEQKLMELVPRGEWQKTTDLLIFHGRRVCSAKNPNCEECVINKFCPSAFTFK